MSSIKKIAAPAGLVMLGALLVTLFLTMFVFIGRAFADTGIPTQDPVTLIEQFYDFIRTGRGTMAIGVAAIFVVWLLRTVLGRWIAWFKTKIGGWTLSFVVAGLNYVGSGLLSEQPLTLSLILNAIGAAFVASGGWEALRDLISKTKKPVVTTITSVSLVGALIAGSGCGPNGPGPIGPVIGTAVIDCVSADRTKIDALLGEFKPLLLEGRVEWSVIYQRAKQAGKSIGGCFLGELVNFYLGGVRLASTGEPPEPDATWEARRVFEKFRVEELDGATLKTEAGNL